MERLRGLGLIAYSLASCSVASARGLRRGWSREEVHAEVRRRAEHALARAGIRVVIDGDERLPDGGYVAVYNESSVPDMAAQHLLWGRFIDRQAVIGAIGRLPFVRRALPITGLVPLPRGDRAGVDRALAELTAALQRGERVLFGGEGGMSGEDRVRPFKRGAALLAIRSGKPLVPLAFHGGHLLMPWRGLKVRGGTLRVRFGEPIAVDGLREDDARELADRAQAAVAALYRELAAADG